MFHGRILFNGDLEKRAKIFIFSGFSSDSMPVNGYSRFNTRR
jgi:hypothetical protein